ncbi:phosphoribosylaminoimidazole-succinocarboxamide synthase [Panacagrimonas perspica]|uniref:Phosphoribosylaminoimidazole-succinocarboxamide synthase n=1 Tax=Panacagrimonas perspica TaxID=381431 RepID=A0A4S3K8S0_9GAMM|nr:phosphoribosylaminoimidazolesuccinocarboxamide synthase [Panacagrimonas perspica]TDU24230.1 phosphoribosylaminoimidazole-succinocarboxamide synthase [Panacagrimonas perspica]THD04639.1 phosphoribosylaminoimidazolesuccinocarboxamide synthase [Panacagrimonas perspica]
MPAPLFQSEISSLPLVHRGKVRDMYAVGDQHLLIVTTDRLSAFDVILPRPIPGKGEVLTALTEFWLTRFSDLVPNQRAPGMRLEDWLKPEERAALVGRAVIVRKLKAIPVECVARGYLIGSGWKDYQKTGTVCGIRLPEGLRMADRLPTPIFTPADKAPVGQHDENISFEDVVSRLGTDLANQLRDLTLEIYDRAARYALERGIIVADTKFEFGLDDDGRVHLIDEVLTPDSSRFWPADTWQPGISPPSFDKQIVRDWLEAQPWDKKPPGPYLPDIIAERTADRYAEARRRLTAD